MMAILAGSFNPMEFNTPIRISKPSTDSIATTQPEVFFWLVGGN
jgi:hypothetical protein